MLLRENYTEEHILRLREETEELAFSVVASHLDTALLNGCLSHIISI